MSRFLVESDPVGLTATELRETGRRAAKLAACMRAHGVDVRLVESTLLPNEDALFCVFDAPSRSVVEEILKGSGLPSGRLIDALDIGKKGDEEGGT
jgi:hypothetical protein